MSKQTINIGASPNDGTGTPLRTSFDYTNQNFTEIYTALGGGVALPGATTQVIFNDGGTNLAGDAGLVYNKTTDALTVAGLVTAGSATITGNLTVDTNTLVANASTDTVSIGTTTTDAKFRILDASGNGVRIGFLPGTFNYNLYDATTHEFRAVNGSNSFGGINENGIGLGRIPAASGIGVAFLAAQSASSDANTLDDYEEGAWSPSVSGEVNLTSTTLVSARYTKIGRVVTVSGSVTTFIITSNTLAYFVLQNLPFTAATVVAGSLYNGTRDTSGSSAVSTNALNGYLPAASGTTSGSAMTLYFSNTYTV